MLAAAHHQGRAHHGEPHETVDGDLLGPGAGDLEDIAADDLHEHAEDDPNQEDRRGNLRAALQLV